MPVAAHARSAQHDEPVGYQEFVAGRGDDLRRLAYLLTGDTDRAEAAVQAGLARLLSRWDGVVGAGEPYAAARAAVVTAARGAWPRSRWYLLRWYPLRWQHRSQQRPGEQWPGEQYWSEQYWSEQGAGAGAARQSLQDVNPQDSARGAGLDQPGLRWDDLRPVLGGLPHQQRAALVLRWYEGLNDDAIGTALGCGAAAAGLLADDGYAAVQARFTAVTDVTAIGDWGGE